MSASRPISGLSNRLWTATTRFGYSFVDLTLVACGRFTEVAHIPENCVSLEAKDLDRHEPNARALVRAVIRQNDPEFALADGLGDLIR
jgi:hypothetical protein